MVVSAFWVMLPAYVPNSAAAAIGGGTPIDGNRRWTDGRRLLGDGKTIRGFIGGVFCGCLIGGLQIFAQDLSLVSALPQLQIQTVILLSSGALVGDMVKSFFKRRFAIERGGKWPVIDQYDFVAGACIFVLIGNPEFVFTYLTLPIMITIIVITPILHRVVNIIGYKLGVKEVPW